MGLELYNISFYMQNCLDVDTFLKNNFGEYLESNTFLDDFFLVNQNFGLVLYRTKY